MSSEWIDSKSLLERPHAGEPVMQPLGVHKAGSQGCLIGTVRLHELLAGLEWGRLFCYPQESG